MMLFVWGEMPVRDERVDEEAEEPSSDQNRFLGGVWQSSWGLRLSLGLVAVLVWVGAMSTPSPSPATSSSGSPPVTTPVVAPASPAPATPQAVDPAPQTSSLPQQPLDITYDYGAGPQPVPGDSPTP
jgi:hypothetical protein